MSEDLKTINDELVKENYELKKELDSVKINLKEKSKEIKRLKNETSIQLI